MVWGGITHDGKNDLVTVRGNMTARVHRNTVLIPVVVPFINRRRGHTVLHTARQCSPAYSLFDNPVPHCKQCRRHALACPVS